MSDTQPLPADRTDPAGPATGPVVVLIHGFAADAATDWPAGRWAGPLAAGGRTSLAAHLPGHRGGPAIVSPDDAEPDRVIAELAATIAAADASEVDLVGYSLGARLAWDLASESPVPVRHLVLGGISPMEPFGAVDVAAARAALAGGAAPSDPITGFVTAMCGAPGNDGSSLVNLVEGMSRAPFDAAARPPAVPTLFVAGTDDPMSDGIEALVERVAGATLTRVPGNHPGALASDEFRAAVFAFLGIG